MGLEMGLRNYRIILKMGKYKMNLFDEEIKTKKKNNLCESSLFVEHNIKC